jgi:O-methyltransferase
MREGLAEPRDRHRDTPREALVKVLRSVRLNRVLARIYYRSFHGFASVGRELPDVVRKCLRRAIEAKTAQQGDYFEFGVFKGHTFLHAQLAARELGLDGMRFFGFDSFQGLPPAVGVDLTKEEHFYEGQFAWSLDRVNSELTKRGVDWKRTFLIKGYFSKTLQAHTRAQYQMTNASVVLVDSDLYESAVTVLKFLKPMLMDKTILIMDDWNAFDRDDSRGERLAMAEFLQGHPQWQAEPWFHYGSKGQVFVIRQVCRSAAAGPRPTHLRPSTRLADGRRGG